MNDHIGLEAVSAASGDIHALSLPVVATVLALVLIISMISSRALRSHSLAARHLFLKINMKLKDTSHIAFIRNLDTSGAVMVTSFAPSKGMEVVLDLGTLPAFPQETTTAFKAVVKKVKALGGQPSNFLVHVKFISNKSDEVKQPLSTFLRQLHT